MVRSKLNLSNVIYIPVVSPENKCECHSSLTDTEQKQIQSTMLERIEREHSYALEVKIHKSSYLIDKK
jgi:hypothetical protein